MKKITKKLSYLVMVIAITLSNFLPFMPMIEVNATSVISELYITSSTTTVDPGELPEFTAASTTDHVTSIDAYGTNSSWMWWGEHSAAWSGFGLDTPTAVNDGKTHYAMSLAVNVEDGYAFDGSTKIYFNGVDVTSLGHTSKNIMSWGGYVQIDLGTAGVEIPKYTVTYDGNGGTGFVNPQTVYSGDSVYLRKNDFTPPAGMSFDKWVINEVEYDQYDPYLPTGNVTATAKWTDKYIRESRATMTPSTINDSITQNDLVFTSQDPSKYSVSLWRVFDETDTSLNTDNNKYPADANFVEGHNYAIEFTFEAVGGYYEYDEINNISTFYLNDELTDISAAVAIGGSVNRRIELVATGANTHTVTFNLNGGEMTSPTNVVVNHGESVSQPTPNPTKNGSIFGGWYEDSEFTVAFDFSKQINANTPVFAKWNPEKYTITLDPNNATSETNSISNIDYNQSIGLGTPQSYNFTIPNGKTFDGWLVSGNKYGVGQNFTVTENVTAIAQWIDALPGNYSVTFKDGSSILEIRNVASGDTVTRPVNNPFKGGYEFVDWYEDSEFTVLFDFSKPITTDTNIFAKFNALPPQDYTLTYDVNGGTPIDSVTRSTGEKITLPQPTKIGSEFIDWQVWDEFDQPVGGYLAGEEFEFFENTTLHANWNEIEPVFEVTYDFNGGTRQGEGSYVTHQVGYAPDISVANFIDWMGVTAPFGKELDAIEINGVRYELGTGYMLNCDTTYRYIWKDQEGAPTKINELNLTISAPKVGDNITDKTKPQITIDSNPNYDIDYIAYITAYPSEKPTGYDEPFVGTIEKDKSYYVEVSLVSKLGYVFTDNKNMTVKVNGKTTNFELGEWNMDGSTYFLIYAKIPSEENVELTTQMGVKKAPTLLVPENGEIRVFENASNIKGYIESKK